MMEFDEDTARMLETAYRGSDVVRRRLATLEALAPKPGDIVVDVGSGLGHLLLELSRAVGDGGNVIGIEPSPAMREAAVKECHGVENVRVLEGSATSLPLADGSADRAASLQVFEYLHDIPAALLEIRRVLRPDGCLVIGDMHWDSWLWHSDEPERMATMMKAWDGHLADRSVPGKLPHLMRQAGFDVVSITPLVCFDTVFRADGLARMMLNLIKAYAVQNCLVDETTVRGWAEEQLRLAAEGRFFFSIVHFVVKGRRHS